MPRKKREKQADGQVQEPVPIGEALKPIGERIEKRVSHVERAGFMKPPPGWIPAWSSSKHGIQVNRSEGDSFQNAAIQFDREPSREEKDMVEVAGFAYDKASKQWPRPKEVFREMAEERGIEVRPGDNVLDAKKLGERISLGRGKSPSR